MNYLFFFVHPSKFHVFRITINYLISRGHKVDILITSKDVLEKLVKNEGWNYINIFPEGRKIKGLSPIISSTINFFRTLHRLRKLIKNKKYDLFITDDLLVFFSKIYKTDSIVFTDDDIEITKQFSILLAKASYILSPKITNLGKYNKKKIGFEGYKELAYLHPNHFKPNKNIIKEFNPNFERFYFIRLVSLKSYHDIGISGISNEKLMKLVSVLEKKGKVYISSERKLPTELEKYKIKISPEKILHVLYFAELFIGDSQTMTSEAAVLGTPSIRCNDFVGKISVMDEKEKKYGLTFNFLPSDFDKMINTIENILQNNKIKEEFRVRGEKMLKEKIDLSKFMIWLFENYPNSVNEYYKNPSIQFNFK